MGGDLWGSGSVGEMAGFAGMDGLGLLDGSFGCGYANGRAGMEMQI